MVIKVIEFFLINVIIYFLGLLVFFYKISIYIIFEWLIEFNGLGIIFFY